MDKKAKKRIDILHVKITKLKLLLVGAKKQPDDPADVPRLESEIAVAEHEIERLKHSTT